MTNEFFEAFVYDTSLPKAYHQALTILQQAEITPCPDWDTNQKECSMTMVIENPLEEPMISKLSFCDPMSLEQYRQEMLDGILDFEVDYGNWSYTYHMRMVGYPITIFGKPDYLNQIHFVIDELQRNPYSRRAVIDIRNNDEDAYSNDPACLQHIQFFIRDNKLHMKVLFRSNDACKATFMNAFALIMLQQRVANELGVEVGSYTHRANSFHCYEKDFKMLDGYVERIKTDPDSLCYSYQDDWKELMEEAQPAINKKVDSLMAQDLPLY